MAWFKEKELVCDCCNSVLPKSKMKDICESCFSRLEDKDMQEVINEVKNQPKKTFNDFLKEEKPLKEILNSLSETEEKNEKEEKQ